MRVGDIKEAFFPVVFDHPVMEEVSGPGLFQLHDPECYYLSQQTSMWISGDSHCQFVVSPQYTSWGNPPKVVEPLMSLWKQLRGANNQELVLALASGDVVMGPQSKDCEVQGVWYALLDRNSKGLSFKALNRASWRSVCENGGVFHIYWRKLKDNNNYNNYNS